MTSKTMAMWTRLRSSVPSSPSELRWLGRSSRRLRRAKIQPPMPVSRETGEIYVFHLVVLNEVCRTGLERDVAAVGTDRRIHTVTVPFRRRADVGLGQADATRIAGRPQARADDRHGKRQHPERDNLQVKYVAWLKLD